MTNATTSQRSKTVLGTMHLPVDGRASPDAGSRLVQSMRNVLEWLVAKGEKSPRLAAIDLLEAHLVDFEANSPITDDLRPWQHLASDLSLALEGSDKASSKRARALADRFRAIITMMSRNPVDELAIRPASRRVLDALVALGGRAPVERVRQASGHSATHLSNILKALRGHGLVSDESDENDRRRKILVLTAKGRALHDAANAGRRTRETGPTTFVSGIHVLRRPEQSAMKPSTVYDRQLSEA